VKRNQRAGGLRANGVTLGPLSDAELAAIHDSCLEVLERTGVWVEADEALDVYADGGCSVDRETHVVRIPPHLVEQSIASAPPGFALCGRDPGKDLMLSDGRVSFANFTEGLRVTDLESGQNRVSVKQDVADAVRVADYLDQMDLTVLPVAAQDCEHAPSAHGFEAAIANTTKHVHAPAITRAETKAIIEMAALVAGGMDALRERPITSAGACTVSPLKIPSAVNEVCLTMARAGLPTLWMTMTLAGATGPVTLAGTLVVQNSEALAALTLIQLAEPGAKVIYGCSTAGMDLRYGAAVVGTPELGLIGACINQLARRCRLPAWIAGL